MGEAQAVLRVRSLARASRGADCCDMLLPHEDRDIAELPGGTVWPACEGELLAMLLVDVAGDLLNQLGLSWG
eukprot:14564938-Alexandrium_andersonii.AAC.1